MSDEKKRRDAARLIGGSIDAFFGINSGIYVRDRHGNSTFADVCEKINEEE